MATNLNTKFSTPSLSADLPDEVEILTIHAQVTATITIDGEEIFSSVYYMYGLKIYIRDIRSIVEAAMLKRGLAITKFVLTVKDMENYTYTSGEITVIYSQLKSITGSESFLLESFLTTRKSALLSRSCPFSLHNYAKPYLLESAYCDIYFTMSSAPDQIRKHTHTFGSKQSDTPTIKSADASYSQFQYLLSLANIRDGIIHRVLYHIGSREFNIYFTPDIPSDTFQFLNAFNLKDTLCIFAATTSKTEIERSEAVYGRRPVYYDESIQVKHEVETAPLTISEARHLTDFLTSREITRQVSDEVFSPVLITDVTPEYSDNNSNPIRIKFTWAYADKTEFLT